VINQESVSSLCQDILLTLRASPEGVREYDLLQSVSAHAVLQAVQQPNSLALFQRHFILRHCLYQLQKQLWDDEQCVLNIDAVNIQIKSTTLQEKTSVAEPTNTALRDYYLDWKNFEIDNAEVDELLASFWRDYARYMQKDEAWAVLGLTADASQHDITMRYRELAGIHHPDKGGDQETFITIRAAYEALRLTEK